MESSQASRYYQDCTIPLERYIRVITTGSLDPLIIEGVPTPQELQDAWISINSSLGELIGNPQERTLHEDAIRLYQLQARICAVKLCVQCLREVANTRIIEALREHDQADGLALDASHPEALAADLQMILNRLTTDEIEVQQILARLESRQERDQQIKVNLDYVHFERMMLAFEEMKGVSYTIEGMTLMRYGLLMAELSRRAGLLKPKT